MIDWLDYIILADMLYKEAQSTGPREARFRTAVSRAYYGAFCLARNYLIKKGFSHLYGADVHSKVKNAFIECDDRIKGRSDYITEIGDYLNDLNEMRKAADYDDVYSANLYEDAQDARNYSEKVTEKLSALK